MHNFIGVNMQRIKSILVVISLIVFSNAIAYDQVYQDVPSCISYAQELTQESIDEQLIEQLLNSCPQLKKLVERLQNPVRYGKNIPRKILLVGPPGVGKSTIAKGIANRIGRPCKFLRASLLINEYKNSGPQNLAREIMPILQSQQPYVIVLDELHCLTENYEKKERSADPGMAEALWSIIDECAKHPQILFIGTTNNATNLPEPLLSRFVNGVVEIPLPDVEQRIQIFNYYLRNIFCSFKQDFIKVLAYRTKSLSGRNIEQLVSDALIYALDRNEMPTLCENDFDRALKDMNSNRSFLAMVGWEKYRKYFKENAHLILTGVSVFVGLGLQYWSMQRQFAFQRNAHIEQKQMQIDASSQQLNQIKELSLNAHAEDMIMREVQHEELKKADLEKFDIQIARDEEKSETSLALQTKIAADSLEAQKHASIDQQQLIKEGAGVALVTAALGFVCPPIVPVIGYVYGKKLLDEIADQKMNISHISDPQEKLFARYNVKTMDEYIQVTSPLTRILNNPSKETFKEVAEFTKCELMFHWPDACAKYRD